MLTRTADQQAKEASSHPHPWCDFIAFFCFVFVGHMNWATSADQGMLRWLCCCFHRARRLSKACICICRLITAKVEICYCEAILIFNLKKKKKKRIKRRGKNKQVSKSPSSRGKCKWRGHGTTWDLGSHSCLSASEPGSSFHRPKNSSLPHTETTDKLLRLLNAIYIWTELFEQGKKKNISLTVCFAQAMWLMDIRNVDFRT